MFLAKPGLTHMISHHVTSEAGKVVCLPLRRRPYHLERILEDEVTAMLCLGVIEPSHSPWRSHPVMVPKPDGSVRVCIDFRKVNEVSRFDAYPMPVVPGLLQCLGQAQVLSKLDLTKGYWQIPLTPSSQEKTAFAAPQGLFHFTQMPFGLHRAAATFQRLMDQVLQNHTQYTAVYIDDIIIYSPTWDQHL